MKRRFPLFGAPVPRRALLVLLALFAVSALFAAQDAWAANVSEAIKLPENPTKAYITLAVLVSAAVLFFLEVIPLACTAMLVPVALTLFGVLDAKTAVTNWGHDIVVLFMCMFIVGQATFVTGFADRVGALAVRLSKGNPRLLLLYAMLAVGLLSTMLSNTGTMVVAVPMIIGMCVKARIAPGKVLMPVAFASSLGGTVTLVGTPPNGIANAMLDKNGFETFGFFEFALIGIPLFAAGLAYYYFIGYRFLPKGRGPVEEMAEEKSLRREHKMKTAIIIFAFVALMMATELMPTAIAAMLGAVLVICTGCVTMEEAYKAVDWDTIFLFAGMLSMSIAMDNSGAAAIVATTVVNLVHSPSMLMLTCCVLSTFITEFMSNTATAALLCPLALPIGAAAGISPLPLALGIAMSASGCFLTPVATPANTIVMGPGKYRFSDYFKYGWPIQVITLLLCWQLIPMIWPFNP